MRRTIFRILLAACVGLLGPGAAVTVAQQPQALVIQGGTLIDDNGGAPLANSVIAHLGGVDPEDLAGWETPLQTRLLGTPGGAEVGQRRFEQGPSVGELSVLNPACRMPTSNQTSLTE